MWSIPSEAEGSAQYCYLHSTKYNRGTHSYPVRYTYSPVLHANHYTYPPAKHGA